MSDFLWPHGLYRPLDSSIHGISQARKLEFAISFSRGISPTRGSNLGLLHWQVDSSPLSHLGRLIATNRMKSPWCWERLRAGGEGDDRGWDGRIASASQPTWLWASSGSWWCHQTILSSVVPFSSCPQSFPASGSFQMSQLFASGGQSIGVSASTQSPIALSENEIKSCVE